ncbi:hypothetical protein [Nonlabens ulvanivorans]|uniref:hypothetical protein n=1 Tax=Nonlabens ulvanivorans TaxID=906888 RepID=UPI0029434A35|nr:hypothetical protein [Nonlabens ulvanivorans]WOI23832.1 hypothetical protein R1T42_05085 [Nonlabens ulvanivorans]
MFHLLLLAKDPMFSSGQITFGIIFFIAFVIIISFMYLKDKGMHKKNYKGVKWILVGFIAFILLLFVIKVSLKS